MADVKDLMAMSREERAARYADKMNLGVPVLAEPSGKIDGDVVPVGDGEARESNDGFQGDDPGANLAGEKHADSRGARNSNKPKFDKKKYQREYMRKWRREKNLGDK